MDLLAWFGDAGHPVGHPSGLLDVLGVGQVSVRPVGGIEVPADAVDPHRRGREPPCRVLGGHDDRDGSIADRRDVEPLHRPRQHVGREHVIDRDVGLSEERGRVIRGVALVLDRDRRDIAFLQPVALHVPVHLQGEDPKQVRPQRPFQDVVEDRQERTLGMWLAGRHLLLGDAQHHVCLPGRHRVPALDRGEHTAAASDVGADEGLAPSAGAIRQVVALAVNPVEGIGRAREADGVDLVERHLRGIECGPRRLEGELLAGLLRAPYEPRHPGADDRDPATRHASRSPGSARSKYASTLPSGSVKVANRCLPSSPPPS